MAYTIQYPITKTSDFTSVAIGYLMDEFAYIYNEFNTSLDLLGSPTATTAAKDTNSTRIATTAFVMGQITTAAGTEITSATSTCGTATRFAREDHTHQINGLCYVPVGGVILWDAPTTAVADIPFGTWQIIDMTDRFPVGYGTLGIAGTGGTDSHNHTISISCVNNAGSTSTVGNIGAYVDATAITAAQMPSHQHSIGQHVNSGSGPNNTWGLAVSAGWGSNLPSTDYTGSDQGHSHTASTGSHAHTSYSSVSASGIIASTAVWPKCRAFAFIKRIA